jgi:hypothetical protein
VLATYDEIRSSQGRRSINIFILIGCLDMFIGGGILQTSKQGLFTPLVCYGVACGALRYKFRPAGMAAMAVVLFITTYYLVPYSQVVRNYTRGIADFHERVDASIYWLENLNEVRAENSRSIEDVMLSTGPHYYDQDRGFLERLSMVGMDDALIDISDHGPQFGYLPVINAFKNIVPHALWPDKPNINFANVYGHEVGVLGDDDTQTSVSFGPSADGFFMGGWVGVLLVLPIVITVMFTILDSVSGSIKNTPWGLGYTIILFHVAPEGTLALCITTTIQTTVILVATVYAARYAMPLVGSLVFPERRKSVLLRRVREFPKTAIPPPPEAAGGPGQA